MKRILILLPWLSGYGGTEVVIKNLLREYNVEKHKLNYQIIVYSLGGFNENPLVNFKNVHVIQLFNNKFLRELLYIFLLPFLIIYLIFKEKPNLIVGTSPIIWSLAKILLKSFKKKTPVVSWYHYSFKSKNVKKIYLKCTDYFFVISKNGKKELINKGINKNKIFIIYNPIIPTKKIILNSNAHNNFIYVGRIEYEDQKNLKELFIALSKINKPWYLKIYGNGSKENLNKLQKLSFKLNINGNIQWNGFKDNVFDNIKYADSLILTSNYEGFPMVIAEALSHGLYVISSNCPNGPSELINSYNGALYKKHDVNGLFNLILNILNSSNEFNHEKIKRSVSYLYVSNYFYNFLKSLNNIDKS